MNTTRIRPKGSHLGARISSDYFESLLLPQLLRGEKGSKQSDEFQARRTKGYDDLKSFGDGATRKKRSNTVP